MNSTELSTLPLDFLKQRLDFEKKTLDDAFKIYELRKKIENEENEENEEKKDVKKTILTECGECGKPYEKEIYDMDLAYGDVVMYKSWMGSFDVMKKCAIRITDTTHKDKGLYFGEGCDPVYGKTLTNVRVDTRNYEVVKLTDGKA